jgi:hypothetical protein
MLAARVSMFSPLAAPEIQVASVAAVPTVSKTGASNGQRGSLVRFGVGKGEELARK